MGNCNKKQNWDSPAQKLQPQNTKEFFQIDETQSPKGANEILIISKENIGKFYKFEKFLGSGGFGAVRSARSKQNPSKIFAVKSINKSKILGKEYLLIRELTILKSLDHPNIIKFFEIYEDQLSFHIVMEFCNGGELLQYIIDNQDKLNEQWIQDLMLQLVSAVHYLHQKSICHRDIKPQNLLLEFTNKNSMPQIKLIDFGLSCFHPTDYHYFSSKALFYMQRLKFFKDIIMNRVISEPLEQSSLSLFQVKFLTSSMTELSSMKKQRLEKQIEAVQSEDHLKKEIFHKRDWIACMLCLKKNQKKEQLQKSYQNIHDSLLFLNHHQLLRTLRLFEIYLKKC